MMYMSIMPTCGIDLALFTKLTDCRKRDIVNLKKSCWVIVDEETFTVRLHPLICEAVLNLNETKAFWHSQSFENSENLSDEEDTDDEDDDIPSSWSVALSEPDDQTIDELSSRFDNEDARKFFKRVLTKRRESLQGTEEWNLFNQILACYVSKVAFRHLLDSVPSQQLPFSVMDVLNGEYRDALMTINKTWTEYAKINSKNSKYIVQTRSHIKDSN